MIVTLNYLNNSYIQEDGIALFTTYQAAVKQKKTVHYIVYQNSSSKDNASHGYNNKGHTVVHCFFLGTIKDFTFFDTPAFLVIVSFLLLC